MKKIVYCHGEDWLKTVYVENDDEFIKSLGVDSSLELDYYKCYDIPIDFNNYHYFIKDYTKEMEKEINLKSNSLYKDGYITGILDCMKVLKYIIGRLYGGYKIMDAFEKVYKYFI